MRDSYSYIEAPVVCPVCGAEFENTEGHIRIVLGALEHWYRIGDLIKWDKKTEAERVQVAALSPVYAFDLDDDYSVWRCRNCKTLFDAPAAIVESNRIMRICLPTHVQTVELFGFDHMFWGIVGYNAEEKKWVIVQ
ncbi:hypothetical protein [Nannocystis sp. SCPEA4]|uniref:hypothetical protein n=1 Tax=Nannocystis sp. SCPEA4 TaxID=2996787 RepID=UPI002270F6C4|nr:hypothetical protein [Nannocystis sp. SCPEA4]MCY1060961.1 hypothetical protein [Nannocystis sp. SCPEA4]